MYAYSIIKTSIPFKFNLRIYCAIFARKSAKMDIKQMSLRYCKFKIEIGSYLFILCNKFGNAYDDWE